MPFLTSAALMCVVLFIIYPHYQYYVDPDGTAYLTISKRYAAGDFAKAVNGYWSPWACWLTAALIKLGMQAIPADVVVNTAGAVGFLFISQSFFLRFNINKNLQWLFNITLALFLCYAVFDQSFDDLWECFFLLGTLRIMVSENFKDRPALWIACGAVGTLAYFAKAYSFPFFILNVICCAYFLSDHDKRLWIRISLTSICVMVLCSLPWILALHNKYGMWTTSTAGTLNTSWYLVGHPYWKDGIKYLIPPAYPDSPYYWEDPWYANGPTPHFWDSWHLFGLQLVRIGLNLWNLLRSMTMLSVFMPVISFILFRYFKTSYKKNTPAVLPNLVVSLSFLLFPLGYALVNFEPRYIWYMVPLTMVAGGMFISNHLLTGKNIGLLKIVPYVFAITFLIYPAWRMYGMYDEGKTDYAIGTELRRMNINGSFASVVKPGHESQQMARIAYFSGNSYYSIPGDQQPTFEQLFPELRRNKVRYYLIYDGSGYYGEFLSIALNDEHGKPFPAVDKDLGPGIGRIMVYTIAP